MGSIWEGKMIVAEYRSKLFEIKEGETVTDLFDRIVDVSAFPQLVIRFAQNAIDPVPFIDPEPTSLDPLHDE